MPTPAKPLSEMDKHLTAEERQARETAEQSVRPVRDVVTLTRPSWLTGKGKKYWDSILARMKGTSILDDLDVEYLAIYCSQLAEREALQRDLVAARKAEEPDPDLIRSLNKQINDKDSRIDKSAAELGCTPSGRVRLAQKRATASAEPDPNGDLFGD
ncbi:MAG: P27 family phage terminase small subunit [Oscillospiraceae bacterium]|nr:P27 family phage terminase small subunit [Oscillospiraceae bacterium]